MMGVAMATMLPGGMLVGLTPAHDGGGCGRKPISVCGL
jgi:hypothetical protein